MARSRMTYSGRQRFWRRVQYAAIVVMLVAAVVLVAALFL